MMRQTSSFRSGGFWLICSAVLAGFLSSLPAGFAMGEVLAAAGPAPIEKPLPPGFVPLKDSVAFQQYQRRPKSDLSKLLFLIDRFSQTDIEIIYEGFHLQAA